MLSSKSASDFFLKLFLIVVIVLIFVPIKSQAADAWYDTSFSARKKITLLNASSSEDLTSFPVAIHLNSSRIDYALTQNSGQDIRFTDSNGTTTLSYEIESWNESGTSTVWVKVPVVNNASNADYIYMYYGSSTATSAASSSAVWDSNYIGVWHLNESPSGTAPQAQNSTANDYDGTSSGTMTFSDLVSGPTGNAWDFDGSNDQIVVSDAALWDATSSLTLEAWILPSSSSNWQGGIVNHDLSNPVYTLRFSTPSNGPFILFDIRTSIGLNAGGFQAPTATSGAWHHAAGTYQSSGANNTKHYFNGAQIGANGAASGDITAGDEGINIGYFKENGTTDRYFFGKIDEVRISNSVRSASWLLASYKSGKDQFTSLSTEESTPTIQFSATSSSVSEGTATATITIALSATSTGSVTVQYSVQASSTATGSGTDYTLANGTSTISAGNTTTSINISIVDDGLLESSETVVLTLSTSTNALLGTSTQHILTITDNDVPAVSFTSSTFSGNEATTTALLIVQANATSASAMTLTFASSGTATYGTDYTMSTTTAVIGAGNTTTSISLTITNDSLDELNETVILTITTSTNSTIGSTSSLTYTITDDDSAPTISFSLATSSVAESTATATIQIALSASSSFITTVQYTVQASSTATGSATDYTLTNGTSTIQAGNTTTSINVSIINDSDVEASEILVLRLSNPASSTLGSVTDHVLTITDNDSYPEVYFTSSGGSGEESVSSVSVNLSLSSAYPGSVTATLALAGTASNNIDFSLSATTVSFASGTTSGSVTLTITDDGNHESNETVEISISTSTPASIGSTSTFSYTIVNNDPLPSSGGGGGSSGSSGSSGATTGGTQTQSQTQSQTQTQGTTTATTTPTLTKPEGLTLREFFVMNRLLLVDFKGYVFTRVLELGAEGEDVRMLQKLLNTLGFPVAQTGPGSKGNETMLYGAGTQAAVKKFQETFRADILDPKGIKIATGNLGEATRQVVNTELRNISVLLKTEQTETLINRFEKSELQAFIGYVFIRNLEPGMNGEDVRMLQKLLNTLGFPVAQTGPGSKGNEITLFTTSTQAALKSFQEYFSKEILDPIGLKSGTGSLRDNTRSIMNDKLNEISEKYRMGLIGHDLQSNLKSTSTASSTENKNEGTAGDDLSIYSYEGTLSKYLNTFSGSLDMKKFSFTKDLELGSEGEDVRLLQEFLNGIGFIIAESGPGSPGEESTVFTESLKEQLEFFTRVFTLDLIKSPVDIAYQGSLKGSIRQELNKAISGVVSPAEEVKKEEQQQAFSLIEYLERVLPKEFYGFSFTRNLEPGMAGEDVMMLQRMLNILGFPVALTGPGSKGNETMLYGAGTQAALKSFQEVFKKEILDPIGLNFGTGSLRQNTRSIINNALKILKETHGVLNEVNNDKVTEEELVGEEYVIDDSGDLFFYYEYSDESQTEDESPLKKYLDAFELSELRKNIFTRDLELGVEGEDVRILQKLLNTLGFIVAESGPGSPGEESTIFTESLRDQLALFQGIFSNEFFKDSSDYNDAGSLKGSSREVLNLLLLGKESEKLVLEKTDSTKLENTTSTDQNNKSKEESEDISSKTSPLEIFLSEILPERIGSFVFERDLEIGSRGDDVRVLQKLLNMAGFVIAESGPGSPGNETVVFGQATQKQLGRFVEAFRKDLEDEDDAKALKGKTRLEVNMILKNLYEKQQKKFGLGAKATSTTLKAIIEKSPLDEFEGYTFSRNLKFGTRGEDVRMLQKLLNILNVPIAKTGPGSRGNETDYFGLATKKSVTTLQERYKSDILTPLKLTRGTGNFMEFSRKTINALLPKN